MSPDHCTEQFQSSLSDGAVATAEAPKAKAKPRSRELPPYHVVLVDDSDHTHEYVMEMVRALFGYPQEQGYRMAQEVDNRGRVIVLTTHKEKAELKRDQIHAFGSDIRVATCKGSMSAYIEPAESD